MTCSDSIPPLKEIKCNDFGGINRKDIFIINAKDCVFNNGEFVRIKRSYGKYKRPVIKKVI